MKTPKNIHQQASMANFRSFFLICGWKDQEELFSLNWDWKFFCIIKGDFRSILKYRSCFLSRLCQLIVRAVWGQIIEKFKIDFSSCWLESIWIDSFGLLRALDLELCRSFLEFLADRWFYWAFKSFLKDLSRCKGGGEKFKGL